MCEIVSTIHNPIWAMKDSSILLHGTDRTATLMASIVVLGYFIIQMAKALKSIAKMNHCHCYEKVENRFNLKTLNKSITYSIASRGRSN